MRAASIKLHVVNQHKWQSLAAGDYIGHVERAEDELALAVRHLTAAQHRRSKAQQRLREELQKAIVAESCGEIIPLTGK